MVHHEGGMRESTVLLMIRPEEEHRNYRYLYNIATQHGFQVQLNNVSEYLACLCAVGPTSRDVLSDLTRDKLSDDKFPHGTVRLIRLGNIPVIACRETTIGTIFIKISKMEFINWSNLSHFLCFHNIRL